jgi:hypothetical protein
MPTSSKSRISRHARICGTRSGQRTRNALGTWSRWSAQGKVRTRRPVSCRSANITYIGKGKQGRFDPFVPVPASLPLDET